MKKDPLIEILKSEFARSKARNRSYSLRSYSRDLGVDASNLSKILSYQKPLGAVLKRKLGKKVGLTDAEVDELLNGYRPFLNTIDKDYNKHTHEKFEVVSAWQHYAILELFKIRGFQPSSAEISKRLGIPKKDAAESLSRLKSVGLLKENSSGLLEPVDDSSSSLLSGSTSQAHRNQQREILEGAITALNKTPIEKRSQSSMTMAIDSNRLEEAKLLIKNFRRQMGRLLSHSENLDEVYQLSISLYPVTNPSTQENL